MTSHGPRDRTVVRRGLVAGVVTWLLAASALSLAGLLGGLGMESLPYQLALTAPFGGIVATLWLWLANLLDVTAERPPSRRRWLWALGLTVGTTFALPLVLAASVGRAG